MFWFGITTILTLLFDLFSFRLHQADKDIEVLLLRQQVRILERKLGYKARINRWEKCLLAVLTGLSRFCVNLSDLNTTIKINDQLVQDFRPVRNGHSVGYKKGIQVEMQRLSTQKDQTC